MGYGSYSLNNASAHYATRETMMTDEIFTQNRKQEINQAMIPDGVVRESRDSEEHPESHAVIVGLDVTGSMGRIPDRLIKGALLKMMEPLIQRGLTHEQILFAAIGDHECDQAPLQVGQFETSDDLIHKWLESVWLEGGGGGNRGESYILAWLFAARQTKLDCYEKRGRRGILFTIGDEPPLWDVPARVVQKITGNSQAGPVNGDEVYEECSKMYDIHHIHVEQGSYKAEKIRPSWSKLEQNFHVANDYEEIPKIMAGIVAGTSESPSESTDTPPQGKPVDEPEETPML